MDICGERPETASALMRLGSIGNRAPIPLSDGPSFICFGGTHATRRCVPTNVRVYNRSAGDALESMTFSPNYT